jgi:hypothetical protein
MGAGLGFKDFTTGEVLTANDVDGYLMQGVWVFANATARDAAVTSPQEGNTCYLKDTDNIMVYSGSAWVTKSATGASGSTLISRTSFSNQTSHIVDSVFSSTYSSYVVVIESIYGATSTDELQLQMRYGSTTQTGAYYFGGSRGVDNAGNLTSVLSSFATSFKIWERISAVGFPSSVNMTFTGVGNASEAARWYGTGIYGLTPYAFFTGGEIASSAGYQTYTGFLLKSSSSNITGTVAVYGLAK